MDPTTPMVPGAIGPSMGVKVAAADAFELTITPELVVDNSEVVVSMDVVEVDRSCVIDGGIGEEGTGPETSAILDDCVDDRLMGANVETEEPLELETGKPFSTVG